MPTRPTPQYASPDDVREAVSAWDNDQLECRLYGHDWRPSTASWGRGKTFLYAVQVCSRCLSKRHQEISPRGAVYAQWIEYADGYLSKGVGRIVGDGRDELRINAMTRLFQITTERTREPHSRATREATEPRPVSSIASRRQRGAA